MDWFLYDNGLRHERIKQILANELISIPSEIIRKPQVKLTFY